MTVICCGLHWRRYDGGSLSWRRERQSPLRLRALVLETNKARPGQARSQTASPAIATQPKEPTAKLFFIHPCFLDEHPSLFICFLCHNKIGSNSQKKKDQPNFCYYDLCRMIWCTTQEQINSSALSGTSACLMLLRSLLDSIPWYRWTKVREFRWTSPSTHYCLPVLWSAGVRFLRSSTSKQRNREGDFWLLPPGSSSLIHRPGQGYRWITA